MDINGIAVVIILLIVFVVSLVLLSQGLHRSISPTEFLAGIARIHDECYQQDDQGPYFDGAKFEDDTAALIRDVLISKGYKRGIDLIDKYNRWL